MTTGCLLFPVGVVEDLSIFHVESIKALPLDMAVHLCPEICWLLPWEYLTVVRLHTLHMHMERGFSQVLNDLGLVQLRV